MDKVDSVLSRQPQGELSPGRQPPNVRAIGLMLLKVVWVMICGAAAVALGNWVAKRLLGPKWMEVFNYGGSLAFLVIIIANPLFGLLLWIVVSPYFGAAHIHIPMGRGIPDLGMVRLVLAVYLTMLAAQLATGRRAMLPITRVDLFALLSLVGIGSSISISYNKIASLAWFFESFCAPVITYFVARYLIRDERAFKGVLRALVLVGLSMAFVILQEQFMGYSWFPVEGSTTYTKHLRRVTGLLGNAAFLAVNIAMVLPFAWHAMLNNRARGRRRLLSICIGIMYVGLFMAYNRTGWAGGVVGILILLLFSSKFRRVFIKLLPIGILLAVLFWQQIVSSYALTERLTAVNPINYRLTSYRLAFDVFLQQPWVGIGFGNLWFLSETMATGSLVLLESVATPHNSYLWVLASAGLAGFIPYMGTFVMILFDSWRLYRRARKTPAINREPLVALWVAAIAYMGMAFTLDILYAVYTNILFFFIVGAVLGYHEALAASAAKMQPSGEMKIAEPPASAVLEPHGA